MNIFYLHSDPKIAVEYLYDKHVVKMVLETAQLLCTAQQHYAEIHNSNRYIPYKKAYYNHPSNKWVRESKANYEWLWNYFCAISGEYEKRYGKVHMSFIKLYTAQMHIAPAGIPDLPFTQPPQCMPDEFKQKCSIQAYWNYYINAKKHIARGKEDLWVYRPREIEKLNIKNYEQSTMEVLS